MLNRTQTGSDPLHPQHSEDTWGIVLTVLCHRHSLKCSILCPEHPGQSRQCLEHSRLFRQHSPMLVQCHRGLHWLQSKHLDTFLQFEVIKCLGEYVCCHVLSAHKCGSNQLVLNTISEPEEVKWKVLHPAVMLWVLAHSNGRLIVHSEDRGARDWVPKLPHEMAHPEDLLSGLNS